MPFLEFRPRATTEAHPSGKGMKSVRPCLTSSPSARNGRTSSTVALSPIADLTPRSGDFQKQTVPASDIHELVFSSKREFVEDFAIDELIGCPK